MIFVQKGKVGLKVKKELTCINQGQWQIFDNGEQNCLERGAWGHSNDQCMLFISTTILTFFPRYVFIFKSQSDIFLSWWDTSTSYI